MLSVLAGRLGSKAGRGPTVFVLTAVSLAGTVLAGRLRPAADMVSHAHPDLATDHPHLTGSDGRHAHSYVIDDLHPKWPCSLVPRPGMMASSRDRHTPARSNPLRVFSCRSDRWIAIMLLIKRTKRATSHWYVRDLLPLMGATLKADRVVEDRNRLTAGGVTSGIDFGLALAARLADEDTAKRIQLLIEYDPKPPFALVAPRKLARRWRTRYFSAVHLLSHRLEKRPR
ncbi:hypothetical protein [Bradyrhizobium sp. CCBAU 45384]|uniref:hypothetical protein n=1 Tax=Bradyrhizobium sp. CCBAU 45384 TaxID=858428 RepID=UPI002FE35F40